MKANFFLLNALSPKQLITMRAISAVVHHPLQTVGSLRLKIMSHLSLRGTAYPCAWYTLDAPQINVDVR